MLDEETRRTQFVYRQTSWIPVLHYGTQLSRSMTIGPVLQMSLCTRSRRPAKMPGALPPTGHSAAASPDQQWGPGRPMLEALSPCPAGKVLSYKCPCAPGAGALAHRHSRQLMQWQGPQLNTANHGCWTCGTRVTQLSPRNEASFRRPGQRLGIQARGHWEHAKGSKVGFRG